MKNKSAIILPLKENYTHKDFGAVSIWVKLYLQYSKNKKNIIFCKKINNAKNLSKNILPIEVNSNFYTNVNYNNIIDFLKKNLSGKENILLKGSRSMRMEEVLDLWK